MPRHGVVFPVSVTSRSSLCACRFPVDGWYTGDTRGRFFAETCSNRKERGGERSWTERARECFKYCMRHAVAQSSSSAGSARGEHWHTYYLLEHTHTHTLSWPSWTRRHACGPDVNYSSLFLNAFFFVLQYKKYKLTVEGVAVRPFFYVLRKLLEGVCVLHHEKKRINKYMKYDTASVSVPIEGPTRYEDKYTFKRQ